MERLVVVCVTPIEILKQPPRPHVPLFVVGHSEEVLDANAGAGAGVEHVDGAGLNAHHQTYVANSTGAAAAKQNEVSHFPLAVGHGGTAVGVVAAAGRHQDAVLPKNVVHQAGTVEPAGALAAGTVGPANQRLAEGDDLFQIHRLRNLDQKGSRVRRSYHGVCGGAKQSAQSGGVGQRSGGEGVRGGGLSESGRHQKACAHCGHRPEMKNPLLGPG